MALETRLRAEEAYYDMSKITDKLYAQSKNGNNFYKLYELIISEDNILLAYRNIKRNTGSNTKGIDGKTVKDYANIPIKPKENGGDNSYDNLLYVDKNVHKLIHLKDEGKIQIYLSHFEKIVSDYNDFINTLNKFRKLARNKIINLSK